MPPRTSWTPQLRLVATALLAAGLDLGTKAAAAALVTAPALAPGTAIGFMVVHNDQSAFSISFGPWTWLVNVVLTMTAIALILPINRDLARVDRRAPIALGLILGGAVGNLASMIAAPRGVLDFVGVRTGPASALAFNVADVAAYLGLAMLLCTVALIVREMVRARRPAVALARAVEHEVPRRVFEERGARRVRPVRPARVVGLELGEDVVSLADVRAAKRAAEWPPITRVRPMSHPLPEPLDRL